MKNDSQNGSLSTPAPKRRSRSFTPEALKDATARSKAVREMQRDEPPTSEESITDFWNVIDAIEAVIASADPEKQKALGVTMASYSEDFSEDFSWSIGSQAPSMLNQLMSAIYTSTALCEECRSAT